MLRSENMKVLTPIRHCRIAVRTGLVLAMILGLYAPLVNSQTFTNTVEMPQTVIHSSTPAAPQNSPKFSSGPRWKELSQAQQNSLQPLMEKWDALTGNHKRKWIAISKNYSSLSSTEQTKLHSRMREWASLSPQQREQARLNFAEMAKLSPTEKATTWEIYQTLSSDEKQKFAEKAVKKPAGAAAIKPVAPEKLAIVPLTRNRTKPPEPIKTETGINAPLPLPPVQSTAAEHTKN